MISLFQIYISRGLFPSQHSGAEEFYTDGRHDENERVQKYSSLELQAKSQQGLLHTRGAAASESCNLITMLSIVLDFPGLKIFFKGKQIFQQDQLVDEMCNVLDKDNHKNLFGTCNLCFESCILKSACGRCSYLVCHDCLKNWYGQTALGKIVLPSQLSCPFCRRYPKSKTLVNANKDVRYIVSIISNQNKERKVKVQMEHEWFYGWCRSCSWVKKAQARSCGGGDNRLPQLNGFVCEECQLDAAINLGDAKKCPGCQAPSFLISGCVHVTCPQCQIHWCYLCEEQFCEDSIYEHIDSMHGDEGYNEDEYYEDD